MIQLNSLKIPKERYISPEKRQIIDEPDKELMTFDVWSYLSIDDINKEEKKTSVLLSDKTAQSAVMVGQAKLKYSSLVKAFEKQTRNIVSKM